MKTSIPHKLAVLGIILNSFVNIHSFSEFHWLLWEVHCIYYTNKSYQKEIISDDL